VFWMKICIHARKALISRGAWRGVFHTNLRKWLSISLQLL
jgi:hypothetical protein